MYPWLLGWYICSHAFIKVFIRVDQLSWIKNCKHYIWGNPLFKGIVCSEEFPKKTSKNHNKLKATPNQSESVDTLTLEEHGNICWRSCCCSVFQSAALWFQGYVDWQGLGPLCVNNRPHFSSVDKWMKIKENLEIFIPMRSPSCSQFVKIFWSTSELSLESHSHKSVSHPSAKV